MLIRKNNKINMPNFFQKYIDNWYHTYLFHMGTKRTEGIISQHYY